MSKAVDIEWWIDRFYYARAVAIDIRSSRVGVVYLDKNISGINLLDHLTMDVGLINRVPGEEDVFLREMRRFAAKNKIDMDKDAEVVIGLPRHLTIFKFIEIPSPDESSIKKILSYDIDRHIPAAKETIYYDCEIIDRKGNMFSIMLVAVQRTVVDYYISLLKKVPLPINVIYVSSFAGLNLYRFCKKNGNKPAVLVDIDGKNMELNIIHKGGISWSKNLTITGDDEPVKMCGDLIAREFDHIAASQNIMNFDDGNKELVLTGTDPLRQRLKGYLKGEKGINVSILDPVNKLMCKREIGGDERHMISTAIGTGLRGISNMFLKVNLLPCELQSKRRSKNFIITLILLAAFFAALMASVFGGYVKDKISLIRLDRELREIKRLAADIESIGIKSETLEKQIRVFSNIQKNSTSKLKIIKELTEIIPPSIWISNLKIYDKDLELSGYADTTSDLIKILEDSLLFENAQFAGTIKTENGKEKFKIVAELE